MTVNELAALMRSAQLGGFGERDVCIHIEKDRRQSRDLSLNRVINPHRDDVHGAVLIVAEY